MYSCVICGDYIDEINGDDRTTYDGGYAHCGCFEELQEKLMNYKKPSSCPYGCDCDYPEKYNSLESCSGCPVGAYYSMPYDM